VLKQLFTFVDSLNWDRTFRTLNYNNLKVLKDY
jgi:hypothetical protein